MATASKETSEAGAFSARNKSTFNATCHQLPRFTLGGQMLPIKTIPGKSTSNILSENIRLPEWWGTNQSPSRTKAQVDAEIRKRNIPDPSYDLDCDGVVSAREYFLAKRFDLDRDGKLNQVERQNAVNALSSGYEDLFRWNVEAAGPQCGKRVIQVRGKVVEGEDFAPVAATYPPHPLSLHKAQVSSLPELQAKRKEELMNDLRKKREEWAKHHPVTMPVQFVKSEFLVECPKHLYTEEIREEHKRQAREMNGISPETQDLKDALKSPSLNYVPVPDVKTRTEFLENLKKDNIRDLSKFGDNNHVNSVERLNIREMGVNRLQHKLETGMTYKMVEEQRRKQMMEHNMKTFANDIIGVHGHELPKFADTPTMNEYWKLREDFYNPSPQHTSLVEYKQGVKYWAKPDDIRLADVKETEPPLDPLKVFEALPEKKEDIAPKINLTPLQQNLDDKKVAFDSSMGRLSRPKATDGVFQKYKSVYDDDPMAQPSFVKKEQEPLYSSFSPDKIFRDPYPYTVGTIRSKTLDTVKHQIPGFGDSRFLGPSSKNSLLSRVTLKKNLGGKEMDAKCVAALGVRTGGFGQAQAEGERTTREGEQYNLK